MNNLNESISKSLYIMCYNYFCSIGKFEWICVSHSATFENMKNHDSVKFSEFEEQAIGDSRLKEEPDDN